jgi:UDP-N-acetylmuramate dehydrogenase
MDSSKIAQAIQKKFPDLNIKTNFSLTPLTTFKLGGPAEIFTITSSSDQLQRLLIYVKTKHPRLPLTILGNASNVLISDTGLPGLVIKNHSENIKILTPKTTKEPTKSKKNISTRRLQLDPKKYLDFSSLNYDESDRPTVLVKIESGVSLPRAIQYLLSKKITGLQWFAGIPGTLGGATWYNLHGGDYHLSDFIKKVKVLNLKTLKTKTLKEKDLSFGYDQSVFQSQPNLIILSTTLELYRGDHLLAQKTAQAWIDQKKKVQPLPSAGSVFQNLDPALATKHGFASPSTGWVIDQKLNWKGRTVGGAQISPQHANFIVNTGTATTQDVFSLISLVQKEFKKRWNINLAPEIKFLGNF